MVNSVAKTIGSILVIHYVKKNTRFYVMEANSLTIVAVVLKMIL